MSNTQQNDSEILPEIKPLSRAEALLLFGENALSPKVNSPWDVVKFQTILTIAFTILAAIWNLFNSTGGLVLSVFLGGALVTLPNLGFILRVGFNLERFGSKPKRFVWGLIVAEVIKITLSLTILIFIIRLNPNLLWVPFLGTYILVLQSFWIIGFKSKTLFHR